MTKLKKISLGIIGCCVVLVVLLFVAAQFFDKFVNQEATINRIQTQVSKAIGGRVELQQLALSFFPQPRITIQRTRFSIPERVSGTLASTAIYPQILPLFIGKLQIARMHVTTPDIEIRLPKPSEPKDADRKPLALETVLVKTRAALSLISTKASDAHFSVENGRLRLHTNAKAGFDLKDINARIDLPADTVNFDIGFKSDPWESVVLKGRMYVGADTSSLAIAELKLDPGELNLSGQLEMNHSLTSPSPSIALKIKSKDLDVASAGKAALFLAAEIPVVQDIFDIVKGGKLSLITFAAHGNSLKDLGKLQNIIIKGHMLDGNIFVPGVEMDLKNVNGDVTILKGILQGRNLEAQLGNSRARQGILKLGLEGENAPFHLDLGIEADLSQLPPLLKDLIVNAAFQKQLAFIENAKGRAVGRLVLGEDLTDIKTGIEISQFELSANYKQLPHPLKIRGSGFLLQGTRMVVKNLSGSMDKSSFSEVFVQLDWDKSPYLEIESAKMRIILEEIYPWLTSFEDLSSTLKDLNSVNGRADLSTLQIKGPLLQPQKWHFKTAGEVQNLKLNSSLYPQTLEITSGQFKLTEKGIAAADLEVKLPDSTLQVSGAVNGYRQGVQNLDLKFSGQIGPETTKTISAIFKYPPELDLKAPISFSSTHLSWNNSRQTTFSGQLSMPQGLEISWDMFLTPDELTIKQFVIGDLDSQASFKLAITDSAFDIFFSGNLNKSSIDRLFLENKILRGSINGNFHAHVILDHSANSMVQGDLKVKDLALTIKRGMPLTINTLFVAAKKNNLHVESAEMSLSDSRFEFKGDVNFRPKGFLMDMQMLADDVNLDHLAQALGMDSKKHDDKNEKSIPTYPLQGNLKLTADRFTYSGLTWSPFMADISLSDSVVGISITEARLCGLDTPGTLKLSSQKVNADFKLTARDQKLHTSIFCLLDKSVKVDGNYMLDGNITAKGRKEALIQSLEGFVNLAATKGRFYGGKFHGTLIKIFRLLNVTEMFKGKLPDINEEGFSYNSIRADTDIKNGKLNLNEVVIDGTSMEIAGHGSIDLTKKYIDAVVLVAPLKAVDFLVKKIPVVSTILNGTLIAVPFKIQGPLDDPKVNLAPSEVGKGLLRIMERTLLLPVEILQPILPPDKKDPG